MTSLRSGHAEILLPGLARVVTTDYKQWPEMYPKYFNVKTSKMKKETELGYDGLQVAATKDEGTSVTYDDLTSGYENVQTHINIGIASRVTEECWDDDLYSVFEGKLAKFLSRSMRQRKELLAANVLNNGFTANYTGSGQSSTGDAKALFASDHPFKSGGTYSNLLTAAADLSVSSLELMLTQIESATEANSANIALIPKLLLVAPANRWAASVILESQLKSGTANHDKNPFLDLDLSYMVVPYMSDTDAWFVETDSHNLVYWKRKADVLKSDNDFDTGDAKIKLTGRYSAGFEEAQGVYGTPGVV